MFPTLGTPRNEVPIPRFPLGGNLVCSHFSRSIHSTFEIFTSNDCVYEEEVEG